MTDAKLSLAEIRDATTAAQGRLDELPSWQREAVEHVSEAAASDETLETLRSAELCQSTEPLLRSFWAGQLTVSPWRRLKLGGL